MIRDAYQFLLNWKNQTGRKPLIIQGARQVGKTWLMKEFGCNEYPQTAYFNFESTKELSAIFKQGYNTQQIIVALNVLAGFNIQPQETLSIFDEIQACPEGSDFRASRVAVRYIPPCVTPPDFSKVFIKKIMFSCKKYKQCVSLI